MENGLTNSKKILMIFKNSFFGLTCKEYSAKTWVDIENEYYTLLKECLKEKDDNTKVEKLNKEFEQVKVLLEEYLTTEIEEKFDFDKPHINEILKFFEIKSKRDIEDYLNEFSKEDHQEIKDFCNNIKDLEQKGQLSGDLQPLRFLNFNYTPIIESYLKKMYNSPFYDFYGRPSQIQIHGELASESNKINFGFGDETDEKYSEIENKNNKEYLEYIKSFQYLQNSNYKDFLDFIDSDKFQVYIMGHSCGLSDRILLKTIFEHKNCRSIKIFFYQNGDYDNYTDIVQNISRHFDDKKLMRSKIVNKLLCDPLPQNVRFEKKTEA